MPGSELESEIADGVVFRVVEVEGRIVGAMGIQDRGDVSLVRHAYTLPAFQGKGVGTTLLRHVLTLTDKPVLIGTWAAATWAIDFYRRNGFVLVSESVKSDLLRRYRSLPARQVETSAVLADERWVREHRSAAFT